MKSSLSSPCTFDHFCNNNALSDAESSDNSHEFGAVSMILHDGGQPFVTAPLTKRDVCMTSAQCGGTTPTH